MSVCETPWCRVAKSLIGHGELRMRHRVVDNRRITGYIITWADEKCGGLYTGQGETIEQALDELLKEKLNSVG